MAQIYDRSSHPRIDGKYAPIYDEPLSPGFGVRLPISLYQYLQGKTNKQALAREILSKALEKMMKEEKDDTL